jgi:outer membrane immunogenic protein
MLSRLGGLVFDSEAAMKKLLLATLAALTLVSGAAYAADLPAPVYRPPPPPPPPAPVYNWTGCFLGAGGGYGMWNDDYWATGTPAGAITGSPTSTAGGRGWFGRGSAGCDYQFSFNPGFANLDVVAGLFGDGDIMSLNTRENLNLGGVTAPEKEGGQWAVGARAGVLVTPRFLTYTTGGFTEAHFDQLNFFNNGVAGPFGSVAGKNYNGYFLGSGFEYAFAFLPGFFLKTEYRFSSFNDAHLAILPAGGAGAAPAGLIFNSTKYVETFGTSLIYRFNWGGY